MSIERDEVVEFDPVRIGGRRRRVDPVAVGVAIVLIGLAAAIVKPWEAGRSMSAPATSVASAVPTASPSIGLTPLPVALDDPTVVAEILAALPSFDAWGVQFVVADEGSDRFSGLWAPADPLDDGTLRVRLGPESAPVAIGITTPIDETPLDVRVHRAVADGSWAWLDVPRITSSGTSSGNVFAPPSIGRGRPSTWLASDYRFDVLLGDRIQHLDVGWDDEDGNHEPPLPASPAADDVPPAPVLVDVLPPGLFVARNGGAQHLEPARGAALTTEADVWLDSPDESDPTMGRGAARASATGVTGVGVVLPDGATDISALLLRLTTDGPFKAPKVAIVDEADRSETPPYIIYGPPSGSSWLPGVYMVRVTWTDAIGPHVGSWPLTLWPGPPAADPILLGAARAFLRHAGADGLIVAPREVLEGQAPAGLVQLLSFVRDEDVDGGVEPIGCGDGTVIAGAPDVIGIGHSFEEATLEVTADLLVPGDDPTPVPLLTVPMAGLTLVRPADGAPFDQGVFRFYLVGADRAIVPTVCIGTSG